MGLIVFISGLHAAEVPQDALEVGFRNPPHTARPQTWWHWMNGSISKEGIRADLEDMQRVGLGGVHLFDVDTKLPPGPVRYGTDAWFDHVRYAIQAAGELGLDVVLQNCPGWSTTGGPWVKVEDSMKRLVWSERDVAGGQRFTGKLPQPAAELDFYRDIAVIAVPADPAPDGARPQASSTLAGLELAPLVDGDPSTAINLPKNAKNVSLTFTYPQPVERRLLRIAYPFSGKGVSVHLDARLEVSEDGVKFRKLRDFSQGGSLFRGGDISVAVPFTPTRGRAFRIVFKGAPAPLNMSEVEFSSAYRIENFLSKSASSSLGKTTPPTNAPLNDPDALAPDRVLDLTQRLAKDGTLTWDAPPGRWTLLRFGYTATGTLNHPSQAEGTGLEVDKMDAAAVRSHFEHALGRILSDAGPAVGKTVTGVLIDSWEARQQNWTADFPAAFLARRGYDLLLFLPAVSGRVVKSLADSEAFLRDFRRTAGDLIAENHHSVIRKLANERGLKLYTEAYGGRTFDEFQCGAASDVNMGEFWYGRSSGRIKITASLAHTTGKRIVAAESYTSVAQDAGWSKAPFDFKPFGDQAFVRGLNMTVLHEYAHQPRSDLRPGFALGSAGSNFGRLNTWWPLARPWLDYLARCQFLLQQGEFAADFLELRSTDLGSFVDDAYADLPEGYDYDQIAPEQLLQAQTDRGAVRLATGVRYWIIVLPKVWVADLRLLQHLGKLARAGVPIVGPPPAAPAGRGDLSRMAEWNAAVAALRLGADMESAIKKAGLEPDFRHSGGSVDYLHRTAGDTDIYFLCTPDKKAVAFTADFRVAGKRPELWDPATGEIAPLPDAPCEGNRTRVKLTLDAAGSCFVVFRPPGAVADGKRWTLLPEVGAFAGPWQVTFQPPGGAPFMREFAALHSWPDDADEAVRAFSGTAVYCKTIEVPATALGNGRRCELDLGAVCDVAEVRVNGQSAGGLWKPPYRLDITAQLKPGSNRVEVTVANRWTNRLMADNKLPPDAEYQTKFNSNPRSFGLLEKFPDWYNDPAKIRARQRTTFESYNPYFKPNAKPEPSGLIGPVSVRFLEAAPAPEQAASLACDVLVYGGTSGGVAAAVEAARLGKKVVLVEPGRHLGGLSSGGLGMTDNGNTETIGGLAREFYQRVYRHYAEPQAWTVQSRADFVGWLPKIWGVDGKRMEEIKAQFLFEPHAAERVFNDLVREAGVQVVFGERLDLKGGVRKEGVRIDRVAMVSGRTFAAKVFIDATYEGDLMARAGVTYIVGREPNSQYGETLNGSFPFPPAAFPKISPYVVPGDPKSGLLPRVEPVPPGPKGSGDRRVQAYNFRVCLTDVPENRVPLTKPSTYHPLDYELLVRHIATLKDVKPGPRKNAAVGLRGNGGDLGICFELVPNRKTDSNCGSEFGSDLFGASYGWAEADYAGRDRIFEEHRNYTLGLLWFLGHDERLPAEVHTEMQRWGLPKDEFVDSGHFPHQLYVREARRMIGDYVITESDARGTRVSVDGVALASYPLDSHGVTLFVDEKGVLHRERGFFTGGFKPFPISYTALRPRAGECDNLLVVSCLSASHAAYGSVRMETVFMMLGHAAGAAASLAIERRVTVQNVPYAPLRERLLAEKQIL